MIHSPETADPCDERRGGPRDAADPLLHDEFVDVVVLRGTRRDSNIQFLIQPDNMLPKVARFPSERRG